MADLMIAGGPGRPSVAAIKPGDDLLKLGFGTTVHFWFGDDGALATIVGQIPPGFLTRPLYKEWILYCWTVRESGGQVQADPREVAEHRWLTVSEIMRLPQLMPSVPEFFRDRGLL